ncbi:MAG: efflux RND transporter periplasmic adaptor subunit [Acidobacteria bacterium]|nr:MAG: efflux RND transporter periplasmic adaptor subunit [Acidobacteriota bacterium]
MIVLILLAGALFAFVTLRNPGAAPVVQTIRPRSEASSQSAVLVATGYVVAHHKIQVGSKITGRVAWIGVEKGNRVRRDQVVVRLEDREYRAQFEQARSSYEAAQARLAELERGSRPEEIDRAKADVDRAQAQLRTDEAQYKRIEGLAKEGVAAAQLLDEAKGRYDSSRANLAALTKTFELIRQGPRKEQIDNARSEAGRDKAAMDYARTILDATEIRVPSDGTILERNVEQGEMVTTSFVGDRGAKSFVVTLADLNDIQVELDINQNDFNRIGPRQPCTVVTDAYPDRVYNCRVDEIAPEANRQKATVQVKVKFTEPDEYIRPEMNARVTFLENEKTVQSPKAEESKLYVVPKRAVLDRESGKAVFVVADGKVQVKPITVAKEVGTDVFVSAGLVGNEAIIVGELLNQLKAGDRVEVK